MRDYAQEAIDLLGHKTLDELRGDRILQLALVRLVEIVGEAASRVSPDLKRQHANIPWRKAAGISNKLIHDYDYIDLDIVYHTVQNDLPGLVQQLQAILP
jgi:uncharacterized protein with HEPN domain